jgi:hypothetical protein
VHETLEQAEAEVKRARAGCRTWSVRERVPDGRSAAARGSRALDLVRRRGRPEDESLGERRPAEPVQPVLGAPRRGAGAEHPGARDQ